MILYTLDEDFLKKDTIDEFNSFIWTERYNKAGDVRLIVPATADMKTKLAPGTFLSLLETKEVMLLETQEIKNGLMTVTGKSLLGFLSNRLIRNSSFHGTRDGVVPGDNKAGEILAFLVQEWCIAGQYLDGIGPPIDATPFDLTSLYGQYAKIPNLTIGAVDTSGPDYYLHPFPFGNVYDALIQIAENYGLGMTLYLDSATPGGYSLKFKNYKGFDHTSDQNVNPLVRFSSILDTLTNTSELHSIAGYKNIVYVFAPNSPVAMFSEPGIATRPDYTELGFKHRPLMVYSEINYNRPDGTPDPPTNQELYDENVYPVLQQMAKDVLANNNFTKMVDGEVVPQSQYQFNVHYSLGDLIELQNDTGLTQKAQVIEYIRSEDENGEKAYPTVTVID